MKSRISFCNWAIIRKDITRFAPLWALYFVGGLLVMLTLVSYNKPHSIAYSLGNCIGYFSMINIVYALICAQLLFGDLFNSRMCNALHAMPPRRETWFCSHMVSGLLFSVVPNTVGILLVLPWLSGYAFAAPLWLLGMTLHFLFFFGLAVFCVFLTGNRFAMASVYAILNFGAMIAYWFIDTIYSPMFYGVNLSEEPFCEFCPVIQIFRSEEAYFRFRWETVPDGHSVRIFEGLGGGWGYLVVVALIGIGLLAAALLLYRRRKLESAGDFIAVKLVEPVFAVVFTLCVGCICAAVEQLFGQTYIVFLCAGLIIGWFAGQMLLQRTVKIFKFKVFLKLAILLLALGASIFLTWLDPVGITSWTPKAENVKAAYVDINNRVSEDSPDYLVMQDVEQIRKVITIHKDLLAERNGNGRMLRFAIRYVMKDGRVVERFYYLYDDTRAWNSVGELYNTPQQTLGYTDWETFVADAKIHFQGHALLEMCIYYDKYVATDKVSYVAQYDSIRRALLEAMKKDCENGVILKFDKSPLTTEFWIELETEIQEDRWYYQSVPINKACENVWAWLEEYKGMVSRFWPEIYQ